MGCKSCLETVLAVKVNPDGFRSNTPRIALPGLILISLCILLIVVSVVCFILHSVWLVSRQDETYEDYFLITAVIAICLGVILGIVGAVWCLFIHKRRRQDLEAYKAKKFAKSMDTLNRSHSSGAPLQTQPSVQYRADTEEVNSVFDKNSQRGGPMQDLSFGPNPYYHGHSYGPRNDLSFGPSPYYHGGPAQYPQQHMPSYAADPETPDYRPVMINSDPPLPRVASRPPEHSVHKVNRKLTEGVQDIKDKISGNSPKGAPYYQRLPPPSNLGITEDDGTASPQAFDYSEEPPFANKPSTKPAELNAPPTRNHGNQPTNNYRYEGGRPAAAQNTSLDDSVSSDESGVEIIFRDGQWYKYRHGRPVGVYVEKPAPRKSANYKYVHGKPVKT